MRPLRRRSSSRSCTRRTLTGSRPVVGSSRTQSSGSAEQRAGYLHLLRHALAQAIDLPRRDVRQFDALQPLERPPASVGAREPLERAEVRQHVDHAQLGVEPALLRQVAKPIEVLAPPRLAEDADRPRIGPDDVHEDADQRALAGAVRPEQPEDLACRDVERHAAQRDGLAVALLEAVEREHRDGGESAASRRWRLPLWLRYSRVRTPRGAASARARLCAPPPTPPPA